MEDTGHKYGTLTATVKVLQLGKMVITLI